MHKFDKNPCMDFKGELCSERNATQRNALERNANFTIVFKEKVIF